VDAINKKKEEQEEIIRLTHELPKAKEKIEEEMIALNGMLKVFDLI
jgi:hypothetical protein